MTFTSTPLSFSLKDAAYIYLGDASREGSRAYVYRDDLGVPTTSTGSTTGVRSCFLPLSSPQPPSRSG